MFGNNVFIWVKCFENKKMVEIVYFFKENDLSVDIIVEVFIIVSCDDCFIVCGGIVGNIIKCVVISELVCGEGLVLMLVMELINFVWEWYCIYFFIYIKMEYEVLFK